MSIASAKMAIRTIRHGLTASHEGPVTIISGLDDEDKPFYVTLTCGQMWRLLKGFTPVDRMLEQLGMPDQTEPEPLGGANRERD